MFSKDRFLILLAAAFLAAHLIGFSATDAQITTPAMPAASPTATPPPDDEGETIRIDTDLVNVLFTAQDRNKRLLTTLRQEDIKLFEDGQPQTITTFLKQIDLPLSLAILVDVSVSQQRTLPEEKRAAISFLDTIVRASKDEVAIISFTGEAKLEQGLTGNLANLRRAVDRIKFVPPAGHIGGGIYTGTPPISGDNQQVQGSTAIWDAIWITSDEVLKAAPAGTRRAIILLSDGVNTFGMKKLDDAFKAALREEVIIYSIGIGDNFYSGVDEGSLRKISERTGGRAYFPKDERELRNAFAQIQEEMRSQYLIAYEPTNAARDGSYRKIDIKLANSQLEKEKIKLTHRQGYFAKYSVKK